MWKPLSARSDRGLFYPNYKAILNLNLLLFRLNLLNYFRNEKREDKQPYGEKDFKGQELSPVSGNPDILQRPYEESKDKSSHDDAQPCTKKVIPKTHLGETHAEIHGSKGEIDKPQI